MSNIYIQEPPTLGKVCLKTTVGDIEIELWSKECPKACRNFVQLCAEGYYDNTIFHRVVPGLIVQGGDPTGTGLAGDSIYGAPFKDEFHSRLRFSRRGLVACANGNKPDDNGSQFFFTLAANPDWNKKHTIFGQVVGNTLYNMLRLEQCGELDKNERPEYPNKILTTEVVANPFSDMVLREKRQLLERQSKDTTKATGIRNFDLLSFGNEAEDEEENYIQINKSLSVKGKSVFDINRPHHQVDPASSQQATEPDLQQSDGDDVETLNEITEPEDLLNKVKQRLKTKKQEIQSSKNNGASESDEDLDQILLDDKKESEKAKLLALKEESKQLRRDLRGKKSEPVAVAMNSNGSSTNPHLSSFLAEKANYKQKSTLAPRKTVKREAEVLDILNKFKDKLNAANQLNDVNRMGESNLPAVSTESDEDVDIPDEDWMGSSFRVENAEKVIREAIDVNLKDEERYALDDPRNPLTKRRREKSRHHDDNRDHRRRPDHHRHKERDERRHKRSRS